MSEVRQAYSEACVGSQQGNGRVIKGDRKPRPRELTDDEKVMQLQARLWAIKGSRRGGVYRYGQLEFDGRDLRQAVVGLCLFAAGWR